MLIIKFFENIEVRINTFEVDLKYYAVNDLGQMALKDFGLPDPVAFTDNFKFVGLADKSTGRLTTKFADINPDFLKTVQFGLLSRQFVTLIVRDFDQDNRCWGRGIERMYYSDF